MNEAMKNNNKRKELKRKPFDELIDTAFLDYLAFGHFEKGEFYYFKPTDTPNRNPTQVADRIWIRLIINHTEKNNYN